MNTVPAPPSTLSKIDDKRRAALSPAVLDAVGLAPGAALVVRADGPGRIVLESPETMLARLREEIRRGKAERDAARDDDEQVPISLADDLLADRRRDRSAWDHPASDRPREER